MRPTSLLVILLALVLAPAAAAGTVDLGQTGGTEACFTDYGFQAAVSSGPGYVVPSGSWTLTSWSTQAPATAAQAALLVVRPGTGTDTYVYVGSTVDLTPGVVNTFPVSVDVEPGDVVGLWGSDDAICARDTTDAGDLWNLVYSRAPVAKPVQGSSDPATFFSSPPPTGYFFQGVRAVFNVAATLQTPPSPAPRVTVCTAKPVPRVGTAGRFLDITGAEWSAGVDEPSSPYYRSTPAIYVQGLGTTCQLSDVVTYGAGTPDDYRDAGYAVDETGLQAPPSIAPSVWGALYEYYVKK